MDKLKIRQEKMFLNEQELQSVEEFEIKSIAEDGYAEVKLTLLAKLI